MGLSLLSFITNVVANLWEALNHNQAGGGAGMREGLAWNETIFIKKSVISGIPS